MEMTIHLDPDIFKIVKAGVKHIEARVNDEKRRRLHVGDTLIFLERPDEVKKIHAVVKKLDLYENFEELVKHYSIKDLYLEDYTKEEFITLLERFYSREEQETYGVVAIDFEIREKSCGVAVIKDGKVLLVHQKTSGNWSLTKGHVEENESEYETAIREVKEETNIDVRIKDGFRKVITYNPKENVKKDVVFFIGEPLNDDIIVQEGEIIEAKYVTREEAKELLEYKDAQDTIDEIFDYYDSNM